MKEKFGKFIISAVVMFVFSLHFSVLQAAYPDRPIRLIIPYPPGGTTDVIMRLTARYLESELGQSIIIVNRKGGGGSVGMFEAMRSKPDGYTYGILLTNTFVGQAVGVAPFTDDDYVPVALVGDVFLTVTAKGNGPYKTLKDYQTAAQKRPGEVGIAMGVGSLAHFVAAQTAEALNATLKQVNAGGGAKKKASVLGGHVDALVEPTPSLVPLHRAGELRILAIFAPERLSFLPDIPIAREYGVELVAAQTNGFMAPKDTPKDRIEIFANALGRLSNNAEYQKKLEGITLVWNYKKGEDLRRYLADLRATVFATAKKLGY